MHGFAFAKPLVEEASQRQAQNWITRPVHAECYSLKILEAMESRRQFLGYFLAHGSGLIY